MSRSPARFTEADLRRAKKVAGRDMSVDILPDGTIRLTPVEALPDKKRSSPVGPREGIVL